MDKEETERVRQTNEGRRADKLARRIERDHDYRVKVWAQSEIRIQGRAAELASMGRPVPQLFRPDFTDRALLTEYAANKDRHAALPTT